MINTTVAMTESAKASTMSQVLFSKGLSPVNALALSACLMNKEHMLGSQMFDINMELAMDTVKVNGNLIDLITDWKEVLVSADLITEDGQEGEYLAQLNEQKLKAYPTPATEEIVRKRRMMPTVKASTLMTKAITILQSTMFNVDEAMLDLAVQVFNENNPSEEAYVIDGCRVLVAQGNVAVHSEFFGDARARLYQGDFHGPNGQSSDMSRSFMELHGVSQDYDVSKAMQVILAEMKDMTGDVRKTANQRKILGDVAFLRFHEDNDMGVKAWSFVKAARLMVALQNGEKPYIGMAFGLDAKCSGPQYGALMVGDAKIAAACGFSAVLTEDAYQLAIKAFGKHAKLFTRSLVKKPYMGIFYGQGFMTFAEVASFGGKGHSLELLTALNSMEGVVTDWMEALAKDSGFDAQMIANAYYFHTIIEKSFGEMSKLRDAINNAHSYKDKEGEVVLRTNVPTSHEMPDGQVISMKYMEMVDINNVAVTHNHVCPDVEVVIELTSMKFNQMSFKTRDYALGNYGRTGFVNMIQATDALVARHIIVELDKLDAQHIIGVHDCFRVNINDMIAGKLHAAIKQAYLNIFANTTTDIVGDYFKGVQAAGSSEQGFSQIIMTRRGTPMNRATLAGLDVKALILGLKNDLDGTGETYYFAK
tara:strand:+ start:1198 stop:3141 length:1944 start_codon:yes stop_codon:yes gene_type:complete